MSLLAKILLPMPEAVTKDKATRAEHLAVSQTAPRCCGPAAPGGGGGPEGGARDPVAVQCSKQWVSRSVAPCPSVAAIRERRCWRHPPPPAAPLGVGVQLATRLDRTVPKN